MTAAFVQKNHGGIGTSQFVGIDVAFSSNVTSGNLIVAIAMWSFSGTTFTLSDTQSNTYTLAVGPVQAGDGSRFKIYYTFASASGALTVSTSATGVSSDAMDLIALEYSGLTSSGQTDATASSTAADGNASITTVTDHDLILAVLSTNGTGDNVAGSGWTSRDAYTGNASNICVDDKTDATPAGTFTGQFITPTTGTLFAKAAVAFKSTATTVSAKRLLTLGAG